MTEFDEDGFGIPGTYAISVVTIGGAKADGTPVPVVRSAVCDVCGGWASGVWCAGNTITKDDSLTDVRESRRTSVMIYTCPAHSDQVVEQLLDEFGFATSYEPDDLALRVAGRGIDPDKR